MAMSNLQNDTDVEISYFLRGLRRQAAWSLAPYGYWQERAGSKVVFDRAYRPIIRIREDGSTETVPSDEIIIYRHQAWYHQGFAWGPNRETRAIVTTIIGLYDLTSELGRRKKLLREGVLPRCDGHEACRANEFAEEVAAIKEAELRGALR